uniref:Uncharacterized protein n=1 Tax=Strigamia maritima TaxID=126957 RepID=T1J856_STRMM
MMIERIIDSGSCAETPVNANRKLKKTRRGKKRKLRNDSSPLVQDEKGESATENGENDKVCENDFWQRPPEKVPKNCNSSRSRILRPTEVPKAPENSTQFIMDDHEDCNLYFSFETRIRAQSGGKKGNSINCNSNEHDQFLGLQDIDFEYESPDDFDRNAFVEQDFEIIYRRAREEELSAFSREEMVRQCIELEQRALELEQQLSRIDPDIVITRLQEELLRLQEESSILKDENDRLRAVTVCSGSNGVQVGACLPQLVTDGAG